MGKSSGSAPAAPDPRETAAAEAEINRVNTYSPSGSGVRWGFTGPNGEFVAGTPGPADVDWGGSAINQRPDLVESYNYGDTVYTHADSAASGGEAGVSAGEVAADAAASSGTGGAATGGAASAGGAEGSNPWGGGTVGTASGTATGTTSGVATGATGDSYWPSGVQSAIQYIESPTEEALRLMLEPASIDLVDRIVTDNITNMPDAPRVQYEDQMSGLLGDLFGSLSGSAPDRATITGRDGMEASVSDLYGAIAGGVPDAAQVEGRWRAGNQTQNLWESLRGGPEDTAQVEGRDALGNAATILAQSLDGGIPNAAQVEGRGQMGAILESIMGGLQENVPGRASVQDRGDIAEKIFDRTARMLSPEVEKNNEKLLQNLQRRGIPIGSEAFNEAYGEQAERTNEALQRLALDADIAAGQEQSRLFGLDQATRNNYLNEIGLASNEMSNLFNVDNAEQNKYLQRAGAAQGMSSGLQDMDSQELGDFISTMNTAMNNTGQLFNLDTAEQNKYLQLMDAAQRGTSGLFNLDSAERQNYLSEGDLAMSRAGQLFGFDQAERGNAISELVAAMGGGYNPPNTVPSGATSGIDYSGMVQDQYASQMQQYQADQNASMGMASTLGNLAAMLFMSSRRLKKVYGQANTDRFAEIVEQMPLSIWSYLPQHAPKGDNSAPHAGPMAEDFHALTGLSSPHNINVIDYLGVVTAALQNALHRIRDLEGLAARPPVGETEYARMN